MNQLITSGKRQYWLVVAALCIALSVAACNNNANATPTPQPDQAQAETLTETPTAVAASEVVQQPIVDVAATAAALQALQTAEASAAPVAGTPVTEPVTGTASAQTSVAVTTTNATTVTPPGINILDEQCSIDPSPDLIGYSDVVGRLGCPLSEATNSEVGINEFGEGPDYKRFMLWFGGDGQIYVLMPDARWLAYTDTWQESEPEIMCNPDNINPATSPPLPRRGFGKLWCTVADVREALGTIEREERLCQHSVVQRFERGRLLACFEDATIRYFRILDEGVWDMETVQ